jgi:hypothetical protein
MDQLSPEVVAMMHEAVKHASTGKGNLEILRRVHEEAVKIREEVLKKHGVLDVAVPAIRELRDSE